MTFLIPSVRLTAAGGELYYGEPEILYCADDGLEGFEVDGFYYVAVGAHVVALLDVRFRGGRGKHADWNVAQFVIAFYVPQNCAAVESGQVQVQQDQVRGDLRGELPTLVKQVDRLGAVHHHRQCDRELAGLQTFPGQVRVTRVIFHQQHLNRLRHHRPPLQPHEL